MSSYPRKRRNDCALSAAKDSRCLAVAPRLCTAAMLLIPSSTVAVVVAPACRLAMERRRVMPVMRSVVPSTIGAASHAMAMTDGRTEKLYCVVQMMTPIA